MGNLSAIQTNGHPLAAEPQLTVVGAGPGDLDLITLKGIKALRSADVVLYDALVNESMLTNYAAPGALCIFVGKRRRHKAFSQEDINELIVDYAKKRGHVVRLKGGDPFVFGRGLEELQYAQDHGVEVSYIPGVSSAIAAAGAAGIAVSLRGASRGFWVLTATTDTGALNPDILEAAQTSATVVILMGLAKLPEIAAAFAAAGKTTLPVAVIQNATLPQQQSVVGTVADIVQQVAANEIGSPAVIILGEVVRHQLSFETALTSIQSF